MITLIIAIIGALTGIIGLIIQFIEYKKSQVRLKIKFIDEKSFYTTGSTSYKCKYFGVISLKISNCSSLPITLDEVKINSSKHCIKYFNKNIQVDKSHKYSNNSFTEITLYDNAKLPLRIDCYDSIYLSFIFPFWDKIESNQFNFNIITPRKNYKYIFRLTSFESKFKENGINEK